MTSKSDILSAAQCRAARGLLKWTQLDLAKQSDVGATTIKQFETETTTPHLSTLKILRQTFENAGIEFIGNTDGGEGLRFKS